MKDQRGSALVLVAMSGLVLIGFSALAIDVGRTLVTRTRLQQVADASVLAGGKDLPIGQSKARDAALDFANRNGLALSAGDVSFPTATSIRVQISRPVETLFAKAFNINSYTIPADATASVQQATSVRNLRPWGIPQQDFNGYQTGQIYKLKLSSKSEEYKGGGNFHALGLDGNGANVYRDTIIKGSNGRFSIGDQVPTEPGNMKGPTEQGCDALLGSDAHANYAAAVAAGDTSCPRIVTLAVIQQSSFGKGKTSLTIAGFASFFITGWKNPDEVQGEFINYVDLNASSNGSTTAVGTQAIVLTD